MGSCLSGRYGRRRLDPFVEELPSLIVSHWRRRGWLQPFAVGEGTIRCDDPRGPSRLLRVQYELSAVDGSALVVDDHHRRFVVDLSATIQPLGGVRWWFLCDLCQKRCGALYEAAYEQYRCRTCLQLPYRSQSAGAAVRARYRADKYYRLAGTLRGARPIRKPRSMRRATFDSLVGRAQHFERIWDQLGVQVQERELASFRARFWKRFPPALRPTFLT